jgi:hypothetical protein
VTLNLERLEEAKQRLDGLSDGVSELIRNTEAAINQVNPGLAVWLWEHENLIPETGDGEYTKNFWQLGYIKFKGDWKIVARPVEYVNDRDPDEGGIAVMGVPIFLANSGPRLLRIHAAKMLSILVNEIVTEMNILSEDIEVCAQRCPFSPMDQLEETRRLYEENREEIEAHDEEYSVMQEKLSEHRRKLMETHNLSLEEVNSLIEVTAEGLANAQKFGVKGGITNPDL